MISTRKRNCLVRSRPAWFVVLAIVYMQGIVSAQIDSSRIDFFPVHIGDQWQYITSTGSILRRSVVSDTSLDGVRYFKGASGVFYSSAYVRVDSALTIWYYRSFGEEHIFRLSVPVGSVYKSAVIDGVTPLGTHIPVMKLDTIIERYAFGELRQVMRFTPGGIDTTSGDTVFCCRVELMKGIGIVYESRYEGESATLQGAIVNGVNFGTISSVAGLSSSSKQELKILLYPNPTNSTATVIVETSISAETTIEVFDPLGRLVSRVFNGHLSRGTSSHAVGLSSFASGSYYITVSSRSYRGVIRLVHTK